jgi:hypothetical protein
MRQIHDKRRSPVRSIASRAPWIAAALAAVLPLGLAHAESDTPSALQAREAARLDLAIRGPGEVTVMPGTRFTIANPGRDIARIEIDLPRGGGIACAQPGEAAATGRKFVLSSGTSLACDAPPESVAYRVFRGPGTSNESKGRIRVASENR